AVLEHERFHNEMIKNAIGKLSEEEIENFIGSLDNINQFMDMQAVKPIREEKDFSLGPINLGKTIIPVGIVQGGMGIGVSLHGLASAVALQGGMGVIGAADIGFREENYGENPKEANKTALRREIKQALALVAQAEQRGPIGVNIPYRLEDYREYVETAIDAGAEVIISGAGLPMTLPGIPKAKKVALIPVVSSVRAARLILKNWRKKHDRIPDAFIFENAFAGGQLGYKESELGRAKANYFKTITEIKNEIGDCPLIVGGGIYNRDGAKKAFLYGADGIQMGSRFVTTKECDIHDAFKKVYLNGKENDVTIVKSPSGILCRAMKNQSIDLQQGELKEELNGALLKAARGDMEHGLVFCGSKAYKAKKLDTVAAVFEEFI
ncbi:MAG: nitronate monooxygenase family protein, partial [Anaerovoracaceae bacterium]